MVVWSNDAAGTASSGPAALIHPGGVAATVGAVVREQPPAASVTVARLHEVADGLPETAHAVYQHPQVRSAIGNAITWIGARR